VSDHAVEFNVSFFRVMQSQEEYFTLKDGGTTLLRNVDNHLTDQAA